MFYILYLKVHRQLQFEQGGRKLLRGSKHLSSFAGSELEPFGRTCLLVYLARAGSEICQPVRSDKYTGRNSMVQREEKYKDVTYYGTTGNQSNPLKKSLIQF